MTFYVDTETECRLPFDIREVAENVAQAVLAAEQCPYAAQVNFLLTDNAGIRERNRRFRGIDQQTDVLSFPNLSYEAPADFSGAEQSFADCFDPDSGELMLGDIVVSQEMVFSQAEEYGHSPLREFAFLIAHSMLHLCGYDHMEENEAAVMEQKQEEVLSSLHITREEKKS